MGERPLVGLTVALFGLGEAGSAISADLVAAGAEVRAYDPADVPDVDGVARLDDPSAAVIGADLVLAVTAAVDAPTALAQALDRMPREVVYADLSTASAAAKRALAETAFAAGLRFVDVALMSTVPGKGLFTPALASGPGAASYAELLEAADVPLEIAGADAGTAATRKLLRSVVLKGFAALLIESLRAAEQAGLAEETWTNLVDQLSTMDADFLERMVLGTGTHAVRRLHEMEETAELLTDLGIDPIMTRGTIESLRRAVRDGVAPPPSLDGR